MEKQPINTDETKGTKDSEAKVENTVEIQETKDITKCEYDDWFGEFPIQ